MSAGTKDSVFEILKNVKDPEIPVLDIVEMGIVRDARFESTSAGQCLVVDITPTYSGCPAMKMIEDEVKQTLRQNGFENVQVKLVYAPAWTTAWLSDVTKQKLKEYGIAPPNHLTQDTLVTLKPRPKSMQCPFCDSLDTEIRSEFGSTACKALYYCKHCLQPFEYFKPL